MRGILVESKVFKEFAKRCMEKLRIKKELDNPKITEKRENNLKNRLLYVEEEISGLELKLQDKIKVS